MGPPSTLRGAWHLVPAYPPPLYLPSIEFLTASHLCLSTSTDCLRFGHGLLLLTSPIVFASVVGLTLNKLKHGTDV